MRGKGMNEKQKQKSTTSDDGHCDGFVQRDTLGTFRTHIYKY